MKIFKRKFNFLKEANKIVGDSEVEKLKAKIKLKNSIIAEQQREIVKLRGEKLALKIKEGLKL